MPLPTLVSQSAALLAFAGQKKFRDGLHSRASSSFKSSACAASPKRP